MFLVKKYGKALLSAILLCSLLFNIALAKVSYFDVYKTGLHIKSGLQTHIGDVKYRNYRWLSLIAESNETKDNIVKDNIKTIELPSFLSSSNIRVFDNSYVTDVIITTKVAVPCHKPFSMLCTLLI